MAHPTAGPLKSFYNTRRMARGRVSWSYNYQGFQYTQNQLYTTPWSYEERRSQPNKAHPNRKHRKRQRQRSPSPFSGTEEYNLKKIQETSDMIKRRLLMPEEEDSGPSNSKSPQYDATPENPTASIKETEKTVKACKKAQYNVEEIHEKIMSHITNLNHGKKMNLICATSSGYDAAIGHIYKQKRLELSKALRNMCANNSAENSEVINNIIPDIGIKIEDLPLEVIRELSSTLDTNFENDQISANAENEDASSFCALYINDIKRELLNSDDERAVERTEGTFEDTTNPEDDAEFTIKAEETEIIDVKMEEEASENFEVNYSSIGSQTDTDLKSATVQTDINLENVHLYTNVDVSSVDEAVSVMFGIDKEIARLTKLRQSIYTSLQQSYAKELKDRISDAENSLCNKCTNSKPTFQLENIAEKILVIKVIQDTIITASESGKIFYHCAKSGKTLKKLEVSKAPIISLCEWKNAKKKYHFMAGSIDNRLYEFDYENLQKIRTVNVKDGVQCLELSWNCIFIGTTHGNLLRYTVKLSAIEFEENISTSSVLVLKATQEGARRVLLVGTRDQPVCVRDAMSGLHLRTMDGLLTPTVYSLILERSMVFCGTKGHDILVFSFNDGHFIHKHDASNSKGICCMKVVGNLLFAGCYNGNIYVYNINNHKCVGIIEGPGGVILSMEIVNNLVVIGTMAFELTTRLIPEHILRINAL